MYYARLVHYVLGTGQRLSAEKITNELDALSRTLEGFRGNVYFFDDPSGEYQALNYWDTKQHAEKAHEVLFPKLELALKELTTQQPTCKFLEVYDVCDQAGLLSSHIRM